VREILELFSLSLIGKKSKCFEVSLEEKFTKIFEYFPHREKHDKNRDFPREGKRYIYKYIIFGFP